MKLVHASDLHLDSPLRGLPLYGGAPVDAFHCVSRRALRRLVDLCLHEHARVLLLAGDLVDGSGRDHKTGLFFVEQMLRLAAAGTRVLSVRGNHDAASRLVKSLLLPWNVREVGLSSVETVVLEDLGLAVHGRSYPEPAVLEDLAASYPIPLPGYVNLGLLHTSAEGSAAHDPYAPCSRRALRRHGYDYWALGHLHKRTVLSSEPWVVFPGNLQGRGLFEPGEKGATVVSIEGGTVTEARHAPLDVVRFGTCTLDVKSARTGDDVARELLKRLVAAAVRAPELGLGVRVVLTGSEGIGALLSMGPERRVALLREAASAVASTPIWIEGVHAALDGERGVTLDIGPRVEALVAA